MILISNLITHKEQWDQKMIMNSEMEIMGKKVVYFKVLSQYSTEQTK